MRLVCFFRRDKTLFFHLLKIYVFVGQLCPLRVGTTLETAPLSIERAFRQSNHNVESQWPGSRPPLLTLREAEWPGAGLNAAFTQWAASFTTVKETTARCSTEPQLQRTLMDRDATETEDENLIRDKFLILNRFVAELKASRSIFRQFQKIFDHFVFFWHFTGKLSFPYSLRGIIHFPPTWASPPADATLCLASGRKGGENWDISALQPWRKKQKVKKNKRTTLCRDDKTPQCQNNAPCLSPPEKEKGKRGTVSFITGEGKGQGAVICAAKGLSGIALCCSWSLSGWFIDRRHRGHADGLSSRVPTRHPEKGLFPQALFIHFFLFASSTTIGRFLQVKSVLTWKKPASWCSRTVQIFFQISHFYLMTNQGRRVPPTSFPVGEFKTKRNWWYINVTPS